MLSRYSGGALKQELESKPTGWYIYQAGGFIMARATQTKILESAEQLFWSGGHKGSSLDNIAKSAGQSKGAVFHYFKNKKDITCQVLRKYTDEQIFDQLEMHFKVTPNNKDALQAWVKSIYEAYEAENFKGGCLLGNMALELSDDDEGVRVEIEAMFSEWENRLVGHFEDPARMGDIVMDKRQFARLVIATLQGVTMTAKVHKDGYRSKLEFDALDELIEGFIV